MRLFYFFITVAFFRTCHSAADGNESDGDTSRKILGSSVVTSVSVVMDTGNKKNTIFTDAVGNPQAKPINPSELASPIDLLNPDRYEFYTFDDNGDLVKRLMSLDEIKSIIATGDSDALDFDSFTAQDFLPEKRVSDVVNNVQSVLKEEMEILKDPISKPIFDTPDVSDSWSMILPAVFGNSGEDIKPAKPAEYVTPETIMIEPASTTPEPQKVDVVLSSITTTRRPAVPPSTYRPTYYSSPTVLTTKVVSSTAPPPPLNVEIIANGISTSDGYSTTQANELVPTRPALSQSTSPSLIRNSTTTIGETSTTNKIASTTTTGWTSTSYKPTSTVLASTNSTISLFTKPTTGLVYEQKNNHTISLTTPLPMKLTSTGMASSKIDIVPQLSTTSTIGNVYPSSSLPKLTTEKPTTWTPNPEDAQLFNIFKEVLSQVSTTEDVNKLPNIASQIGFESNKVQTTLSDENLSTLATETIPTTTQLDNEAVTTNLPPLLNSLNDKQKLSASELLDQLLLTTNIYEINTELASSKLNTSLLDVRVDNISTEDPGDLDQQMTTTDHDIISYPPTTDMTLIHSIEQLLSQAVGDIQTVLTTGSPTDNLSSLSKEAEIPLKDVATTEINSSTMEELEYTTTTIAPPPETKPTEQESTTFYYIIKKNPNFTTTKGASRLELIRNGTKPAKADLSLEQEELKNITLLQNSFTNTTEPNEILKESETKGISVNSTPDELLEPSSTTTSEVTFTTEATTLENQDQTTLQYDTTENDERFAVETTTEEVTTEFSTVKQDQHASALEKNPPQNQTWTLVSTLAPQQALDQNNPAPIIPYPDIVDSKPVAVDLVPKPMQGFGLEESTSSLDIDIHQFVQLCNELAFGFWKTVTTGLSSARSVFVSPFAATSMLAMVFLGAKGATSEEMNEILKLDDMVTFNPHLTFKSVSESLVSDPNSGVASTAMIRELYSDRSKGKLLEFYKNRVKAFYDGHVEEVSYREIGDVIRRRSNLLVKKYTNGKYPQFFSDASIVPRAPLSGVSINIFETDCAQTSTEGRDGELYFVVHPSIKQRRLVPIPAVVYQTGFLAGYEPSLDATAVALGSKDQVVSTILVVPGQQGIAAPGDGLNRLEKRLVESSFKKGAWSRLLRSLIPRPGLEVQIPRFSHRSVINATNTLQKMGLHELFNPDSADLRGLNGVANELHLSDVLQVNMFGTCGDKRADEARHSEVYPATTMRARSARHLRIKSLDHEEPRDYQRSFPDPLHDPFLLELPLSLRPRQARIPDVPRLRFDRPFLYFVRHNPTGLILHMGRFNPRLLP